MRRKTYIFRYCVERSEKDFEVRKDAIPKDMGSCFQKNIPAVMRIGVIRRRGQKLLL